MQACGLNYNMHTRSKPVRIFEGSETVRGNDGGQEAEDVVLRPRRNPGQLHWELSIRNLRLVTDLSCILLLS